MRFIFIVFLFLLTLGRIPYANDLQGSEILAIEEMKKDDPWGASTNPEKMVNQLNYYIQLASDINLNKLSNKSKTKFKIISRNVNEIVMEEVD